MEKILARIVQVLFHPLLISTIGMLILFRTNLYVVFMSVEIRQIVMLTTLVSTCFIPLVFIISLGIIKKHFNDKGMFPELTMIYIFTAISYYLGYYFLSKMPLSGFFKAVFMAGTLVLITLSLISLRWNISSHMAGMGAIAGVSIAIMLRLGVFNPFFLTAVLIAGGLTGFSQLALEKNNPAQIFAGYMIGFGILFLVFRYI